MGMRGLREGGRERIKEEELGQEKGREMEGERGREGKKRRITWAVEKSEGRGGGISFPWQCSVR